MDYISPGSPWEDELHRELQCRVMSFSSESWRRDLTTLSGRMPRSAIRRSPEVFVPVLAASRAAQPRTAPPAMPAGARTTLN